MKTLQTYRFLALSLLGLILITGCNRTQAPTASEEALSEAAKPSLQKSGTGIIAPGVVAWWPGDGNTDDIIGGNDGTLNGAGFASGQVGQAFSFDGAGDFVDFGTAVGNFGTADFTFDLWVNFNSLAGEQVLIEKWDNGPSFVGFATHIALSGWTLTKLDDNTLRFAFASSSGEVDIDRNPPGGITTGTWNHIALTRSSGTITPYWNGDPLVSGSISGSIVLTSFPLLLGRRSDNRGFFLNGLIDEVEIYNRALSASEIEAIFDAGSRGKKPKKMVEICHKPGTPVEKTIVVPYHALAGHLGHGDTIGPCE